MEKEGMNVTFFKPETLAEIWQIPVSTVWKFIREGKIKGVVRMGNRYRIPYESKVEFEERYCVHA
jgi:excisionase family DNA binding protein